MAFVNELIPPGAFEHGVYVQALSTYKQTGVKRWAIDPGRHAVLIAGRMSNQAPYPWIYHLGLEEVVYDIAAKYNISGERESGLTYTFTIQNISAPSTTSVKSVLAPSFKAMVEEAFDAFVRGLDPDQKINTVLVKDYPEIKE